MPSKRLSCFCGFAVMSLTDNEAKVILLVILRRIMGDNLIKKNE